MNRDLTRHVSDIEIKDVLSLIGSDHASGPDGFTASFYQQFWNAIGTDVCNMVHSFFMTGEMEPNINHTNICLIPKFMSDYRPIDLCLVAYKLISKILCLRLQRCMDVIISDSQAAFVPDRQILNNILVAHELMHALKTNIKTDISKIIT